MDEMSPLINELKSHPIAFLGGFLSGMFRLSLAEDPVKSWLDQRAGAPPYPSPSSTSRLDSGNGSGPQSISIE